MEEDLKFLTARGGRTPVIVRSLDGSVVPESELRNVHNFRSVVVYTSTMNVRTNTCEHMKCLTRINLLVVSA